MTDPDFNAVFYCGFFFGALAISVAWLLIG